jgi:hypothetical protein
MLDIAFSNQLVQQDPRDSGISRLTRETLTQVLFRLTRHPGLQNLAPPSTWPLGCIKLITPYVIPNAVFFAKRQVNCPVLGTDNISAHVTQGQVPHGSALINTNGERCRLSQHQHHSWGPDLGAACVCASGSSHPHTRRRQIRHQST